MLKKIIKTFATLGLVVLAIYLLDIGCFIRNLTGFPCVGCGVTRACLAFLEGDFSKAFYYHPLFLLTLALILVFSFKPNLINKTDKKIKFILIAILVLYIGVYAVRMFMYFPDTEPMNYNYDAPLYKFLFSHFNFG